jgi:hypothetical protein
MNEPSLSFSLAKSSTYNQAVFESVNDKEEYVTAEFSDPYIQELYKEYASALSVEQRKGWATKIDEARFAFYKKWLKAKRKDIPKARTPKMPDDIA